MPEMVILDDIRVTVWQDSDGRRFEIISEKPRTREHITEVLRQAAVINMRGERWKQVVAAVEESQNV